MGNYEFYYAGGWLCALAGSSPETDLRPEEFYAYLKPLLATYQPKDEQEAYLIKMLGGYKVQEEYNEQMPMLMQMGILENKS